MEVLYHVWSSRSDATASAGYVLTMITINYFLPLEYDQ